MGEIISFAKTNFRNQEVQFGIKQDDRRRHFYAIGKTGMGKTNMLENMVIQDIRNGHGVCFIDPHGDTAEKLIGMIPPDRVDDVIYFNPADQNFPICFNVMEKVEPEFRPLIASGLVGVFKKLWADSWGPRLEYILRNAILGLLEYPGSTLLGVMRILVEKNYRKRVTDKITDPIVRSFWLDEFPKWSEKQIQEVIAPIQNKVGQFLTSPIIRNIIGQTKSTFNIREIMDDRKILILNLSKGRIGEDNSSLIGAMIITKIQLEVMGRVDMPEDERKDFYLYVDEFQNFATESFANILSEARKYRLNLILANQYVNQLEETVRDAIFGNVGTIVSFRVGAADAEFLEKEFEPVFMMHDIVNLPKYGIYLKLMIDGIAGDAFSATTLPPVERLHSDSTEQVIQMSRERYAISKQEAEERIARLMGILPENDLANLAKKSLEVKKSLPNESLNSSSENKTSARSTALKTLVDESSMNFEDKEETYAEFVYKEKQKMEELRRKMELENKVEQEKQKALELEKANLEKINLERIKNTLKNSNLNSNQVNQVNQVQNPSFNANFNSNLQSLNSNSNLVQNQNSNNFSNNQNSLNVVQIQDQNKNQLEKPEIESQNQEIIKEEIKIVETPIHRVSNDENKNQEVTNEVNEIEIKIEEKKQEIISEISEKELNVEKSLVKNDEMELAVIPKISQEVIVQDQIKNSFSNFSQSGVEEKTENLVIEEEKETEKVEEVSNSQVFNQNLIQDKSNNLENLQEEIQSENGGVEIENEVEQEQEIAKPTKVMFKTNCSTCDEEIEVPFQPDGVRPVFCRECIKDYQRAVAKAKEEENQKNDGKNPVSSPNQNNVAREKNKKKRYNSKKLNPKAEFKEQIFVSKEKPLSFSQIPHIAPKKFADSTKKGVDFAGLREMIQKVKEN